MNGVAELMDEDEGQDPLFLTEHVQRCDVADILAFVRNTLRLRQTR